MWRLENSACTAVGDCKPRTTKQDSKGSGKKCNCKLFAISYLIGVGNLAFAELADGCEDAAVVND